MPGTINPNLCNFKFEQIFLQLCAKQHWTSKQAELGNTELGNRELFEESAQKKVSAQRYLKKLNTAVK